VVQIPSAWLFSQVYAGKPSLTLELDQHTADAGIDTRIEAAVDIIIRYRRLTRPEPQEKTFVQASIVSNGNILMVRSSDGKEYPLTHETVE